MRSKGLRGGNNVDEARREIEQAIAGDRPLEDVLSQVIEEGLRLVQAEACSVVLLDERSGELVFFTTGGKQGDRPVEACRFPADKGVAGDVVASGKTALVNDPASEPRFYDEVDKF